MYCPQLSNLATFGSGGATSFQPGGLVHFQTDTEDYGATVYDLLNYRVTTGISVSTSPAGINRSLLEQFGISSSNDLTLSTYTSRMDSKFVVPAANLTGTLYKGHVSVGSLLGKQDVSIDGSADFFMGGFTVRDLINNAYDIQSMETGFSLQSAMRNDYIATTTPTMFTGSYESEDYTKFLQNFASEIVSYVVLQTPAINITTGASSSFSLIQKNVSNAIVYPSFDNVFLFKTFSVHGYIQGPSKLDDYTLPTDSQSLIEPHNQATLDKMIDMINQDDGVGSIEPSTISALDSSVIPRGLLDLLKAMPKPLLKSTTIAAGGFGGLTFKLMDSNPDRRNQFLSHTDGKILKPKSKKVKKNNKNDEESKKNMKKDPNYVYPLDKEGFPRGFMKGILRHVKNKTSLSRGLEKGLSELTEDARKNFYAQYGIDDSRIVYKK